MSSDVLCLAGRRYTREELFSAEVSLLEALDYRLVVPLPNQFLSYYLGRLGYDPFLYSLSMYFLDLFLLSPRYNVRPASLGALAALYLSCTYSRLSGLSADLDRLLALSPVPRSELRSAASDLLACLALRESSNFLRLRQLYTSDRLFSVASLDYSDLVAAIDADTL